MKEAVFELGPTSMSGADIGTVQVADTMSQRADRRWRIVCGRQAFRGADGRDAHVGVEGTVGGCDKRWAGGSGSDVEDRECSAGRSVHWSLQAASLKSGARFLVGIAMANGNLS